MSITPTRLVALEILDSRSRPTVLVRLETSSGHGVQAGVPSGASTGSGEAVELRDGDPARQLKSGAPARGERTAKYNRLLEIAAEDAGLPFASDLTT